MRGDELPHALFAAEAKEAKEAKEAREFFGKSLVANLEVTARIQCRHAGICRTGHAPLVAEYFFLRSKDVLMLPPKALRGPGWDELGTLKACAFEAVARTAGAGVRRIIRDAEIDGGKKRQSRAVLLYDPDGLGDWVE